MKLHKNITNINLKKEILKLTKYNKMYKIRADVYSFYDINDNWVTDLDIVVLIDGEYHAFSIIDNKTEEETNILKNEGVKIIKYLQNHFSNIEKDILIYHQ